MVARLLHRCGLYLGSPKDLMPPAPDNPEGFYENLRFVAINDQILARFGGAWDCPPNLAAGWEHDPELASFHAQSAALIAEFNGHAVWGWKDPRNSLTAAFWRALLPDLQFVVCLRNPLEVVDSLLRRQGYTGALGQSLWLRYYRELLAAVPPEKRVVTHYDSYFVDPCAETQRVLTALGFPTQKKAIEQVCSVTSGRLRHHRRTISDLVTSDVEPDVLKCYLELCAEAQVEMVPKVFAGTGEAVALGAESHARSRDVLRLKAYAGELERRLERLATRVLDRETTAAELARQLAAQKQHAAAISEQVEHSERQLAAEKRAAETALGVLATQLAHAEKALADMAGLPALLAESEAAIRALHAQIAGIGASRSWRLIHRVKRIRSKLLPFRKAS